MDVSNQPSLAGSRLIIPCAPIRWLPYPLAPPGLSVGSAGKIEDRGSEKSEKKSSQNWACLVWKFLMELVRVFCTYLGAPNRHIVKNQKQIRKCIQHVGSAYLLPIFPVWSQPMGAHGWPSQGKQRPGPGHPWQGADHFAGDCRDSVRLLTQAHG